MIQNQAQILSVGTAVPKKFLTNYHFEEYLETSDEWIAKRTGIKKRYISEEGTSDATATLGSEATKKALEKAGIEPCEVDTLICATFTPDNFFPSTACGICKTIGCTSAFAFDLSAACSGFIYGLTVANSLIMSGQSKTVVVVGAEVISQALDWNDRSTCILFGDGAGAVVLRSSKDSSHGILGTTVETDCSLGHILKLPAWDGKQKISMNGNEVFKRAVRLMTESTEKSLEKCGLSKKDVDLLIPHQANIRIIDSVAKRLQLPSEKVICNVEEYGNTSSASIPLALDKAWSDGMIIDGTIVAFAALGGGLTIGSAVVKFQFDN